MFALLSAVLLATSVVALPAPHMAGSERQAQYWISGNIQVVDYNTGASLGVVGNQISGSGYGLQLSTGSALGAIIALDQNGPTNIYAQNNDAAYTYIGAAVPLAGNSGSAYLATGSPNSVILTSTDLTADGAKPANGRNAMSDLFGTADPIESGIWSFPVYQLTPCAPPDFCLPTYEFTAQWVNPDGSKPATYFWYSLTSNLLGMTGDYDAMVANSEGGFTQVRLMIS